MSFDKNLQMKMSKEAYHAAKVRAGNLGSSAGQPRPYAKQNMQKARLHSPQLIGQSLTITPKHQHYPFHVGVYYEWQVVEEGEGEVYRDGRFLTHATASEVWEHFKVIKKGKQ